MDVHSILYRFTTWLSGNQQRKMFINSCVSRLSNINDSSAVAIVRENLARRKITQQTDDVHPNNVTDRFEVIGHVPALMATRLSKLLKRPTNCAKLIIKGKRENRGGYGLEVPWKYIFEGDSFSCGTAVGPRRPISPNETSLIICISCCVWWAVERNWTRCAYHRAKRY